jgi:hypothetical protein
MGRFAPTYEDRLKREIRDAIAIDPIATIPELTERLSKRLDHSFDPLTSKSRAIKSLDKLLLRETVCRSSSAWPSPARIIVYLPRSLADHKFQCLTRRSRRSGKGACDAHRRVF